MVVAGSEHGAGICAGRELFAVNGDGGAVGARTKLDEAALSESEIAGETVSHRDEHENADDRENREHHDDIYGDDADPVFSEGMRVVHGCWDAL